MSAATSSASRAAEGTGVAPGAAASSGDSSAVALGLLSHAVRASASACTTHTVNHSSLVSVDRGFEGNADWSVLLSGAQV